MATAVFSKLVTLILLYTLIIRYQGSLNRKIHYDTQENKLMCSNGLFGNYECHFMITRKKYPLRIRPLSKKTHGCKAYVTLLLILSGDVELNPGPGRTDICKEKECEIIEDQSKDGQGKLKVKGKDEKVDGKQKKQSIKKVKKPLLATNEITDIESVIKLYHIKPNLPLPEEHTSTFLERFKDVQHYSYSTNNTQIASTILIFNDQIYEKLGMDDSYEISWTDLIPEGEKVVNEILIQIDKDGDHWVDIIIHVPSATICIIGKGIDEFRNDQLKEIENKQHESESHESHESKLDPIQEVPMHDMPLSASQHESVIFFKPELNDALKPVWNEIKIMQEEILNLKSQNNDKIYSNDVVKLQTKNSELEKENKTLKAEIEKLKNEIERVKKSKNESRPSSDMSWQTKLGFRNSDSHKHPQSQHPNHNHFNQNVEPFHIPPANNMQMFYHPNRFQSLQFIPQDMQFNSHHSITSHTQTIPRNKSPPINGPSGTLSSILSRNTNENIIQTNSTKPVNTSTIPKSRTQQPATQNPHRPRIPDHQDLSSRKQSIVIVGDSIIKNVMPHKLSRSLQSYVNRISIGGMKAREMKHYIIPSIEKRPDAVVLHCGINDLMNSPDHPQQIGEEIKDVAMTIKRQIPTCSIFISSIANQVKYPNLNENVRELNSILLNVCESNSFQYIDNSNIIQEDLNNSGLHLNKKGSTKLACNFRDCIKANQRA